MNQCNFCSALYDKKCYPSYCPICHREQRSTTPKIVVVLVPIIHDPQDDPRRWIDSGWKDKDGNVIRRCKDA
jgi:hypothetical protein